MNTLRLLSSYFPQKGQEISDLVSCLKGLHLSINNLRQFDGTFYIVTTEKKVKTDETFWIKFSMCFGDLQRRNLVTS